MDISTGTILAPLAHPSLPKREVKLDSHNLTINYGQTVADRAEPCYDGYWQVMGGLSIGTTSGPLLSLTPGIGGTKIGNSNYSLNSPLFHYIIVTNASKYQ